MLDCTVQNVTTVAAVFHDAAALQQPLPLCAVTVIRCKRYAHAIQHKTLLDSTYLLAILHHHVCFELFQVHLATPPAVICAASPLCK
jgi:hypothetical protein